LRRILVTVCRGRAHSVRMPIKQIKRSPLMKLALVSLCLAAFSIPGLVKAGEEIPFALVPPAAQQAVYQVAPGIRVKEVEVEKKRGWIVFEVEGRSRFYDYEIKVTPTGQILKFKCESRD
jgi:hypothetical protein